MNGSNSSPRGMCGSRRHFLSTSAMGLGSVALSCLLNDDGLLASPEKPELEAPHYDLLPKAPHFKPTARAMISLFMQGGPSHIDLFDPKPELDRLNGQKFPGEVKYDNAAEASSKVLASPWKFRRYGDCGMEMSELLPHIGGVADEITLVRSMHTGVNNHGQSIFALNNGRIAAGRPVVGSWLTYGLGTESQELPAYIVLTDPGGLPVEGVDNWSNGWLPSLYQGTVVRPKEPRILNLDPPVHMTPDSQRRYLSFLERINREHLERHPGELDLEARIASYELAAHMQTAAKEAVDISRESKETHKLYGIDDPKTADLGSRCLMARRLVERGVRFVQICTGNQHWDHHHTIRTRLPEQCLRVDKPSAALVRDLNERGLLDTTLVQWGGEMGRLPVVENDKKEKAGRDHNTYGFSMWMAGGGVRGGMTYGETDEFGHKAVKDVVTHCDYHATLLHMFGLDPTRLTYKHNGIEKSLIDGQASRVVKEILRG
ncbi:MAG TPA: DUF1501 domain-containing protein [Pirellulales bacterium]|jgi:hypothetical protein|nr:DUF1501 domain-containing protein [Pirellulales bacterium]